MQNVGRGSAFFCGGVPGGRFAAVRGFVWRRGRLRLGWGRGIGSECVKFSRGCVKFSRAGLGAVVQVGEIPLKTMLCAPIFIGTGIAKSKV